MSTRTQIRFVDPSGNRVAQVYNHSDGYPGSIIPELAELRDTLQEQGWIRGPEYAAAQFILLRKLGSMPLYASDLDDDADPFDVSNYDKARFLGGHGVENPADNIHGDEEYIYEVTIPLDREERDQWEVKVSKSRWDGGFKSPEWETRSGEIKGYDYGEDEDAWDIAEWAFEGTLDHAANAIENRGDDESDVEALERANLESAS